jgi:transcriptional regulator with XRE-family HTH domain
MQTFRNRPADIGRSRSRELARRFGTELRISRVTAGMTQAQLGARAGVSQACVSAAESGDPGLALEIRCMLAAACGYELGWRLYPVASVPLRDSGQLGIAKAIVTALHPSWQPRLEVSVGPGDPRAADLVLTRDGELAHIEIERALVDAQAQLRQAQQKRDVIAQRDDRPVRLILAMPETPAIRQRLAPFEQLLEKVLPVPSRRIWHALRTGNPVGGDGILFVKPRGSGTKA